MTLNELLAALANTPALPGARCRLRSDLFDVDSGDARTETPSERAERHQAARNVCSTCPELNACRSWAESTHPGELSGIVGGDLYDSAATVSRLTTRPGVVEFVCSRKSVTVADVAKALDMPPNSASMALGRAVRDGLVYRPARGVYAAVVREQVSA